MQKTSKTAAHGFFDPIELDRKFPVSFPAFQTPPDEPHVHNCFEIGLCKRGAGVFIIGNKVFTCSTGDAVFINQHEFHILQRDVPQNSEWRFVYLDPIGLLSGQIRLDEEIFAIRRFAGEEFSNVVHPQDHPELTMLTAFFVEELENRRRNFESSARAALWAILTLLARITPKNPPPENMAGERETLYPALKYIASHYAEPVSLEKLAKLCNCSVSTFRRVFSRTMNALPSEYIEDFRLKNAQIQLSQSARGICEIALESGFGSVSNFNRQFKKRFGIPPGEYRKKN
ncbi:MAG: helix-turn-helix domain-containing protein [Victivallaceae bacterium]